MDITARKCAAFCTQGRARSVKPPRGQFPPCSRQSPHAISHCFFGIAGGVATICPVCREAPHRKALRHLPRVVPQSCPQLLWISPGAPAVRPPATASPAARLLAAAISGACVRTGKGDGTKDGSTSPPGNAHHSVHSPVRGVSSPRMNNPCAPEAVDTNNITHCFCVIVMLAGYNLSNLSRSPVPQGLAASAPSCSTELSTASVDIRGTAQRGSRRPQGRPRASRTPQSPAGASATAKGAERKTGGRHEPEMPPLCSQARAWYVKPPLAQFPPGSRQLPHLITLCFCANDSGLATFCPVCHEARRARLCDICPELFHRVVHSICG